MKNFIKKKAGAINHLFHTLEHLILSAMWEVFANRHEQMRTNYPNRKFKSAANARKLIRNVQLP